MAANHATRELPEVCSPPPSKPLNFLSELPLSPFAAASLKGRPGVPWQPLGRPTAGDRQQQVVHDGDGADHGSSGDLGMDADWQEREVLDDQENQQPGGGCAAAAVQPPATWLFSPVRRPGTRSSGSGGGLATPAGPARPVSAPRAIPSPLLSPTAVMSTPPKEALPAAAAPPTADRLASSSLAHAPSFGSWLVPAACRPPSPPPVPLAKPAVDVADVVAGLAVDCRAAQPFERGGPTMLDRLLAELGDSHYPASCEPAGRRRGSMRPPPHAAGAATSAPGCLLARPGTGPGFLHAVACSCLTQQEQLRLWVPFPQWVALPALPPLHPTPTDLPPPTPQ